MSSLISISKTSEELPVAPLLTLTRTAIGLGLGILIADKIKRICWILIAIFHGSAATACRRRGGEERSGEAAEVADAPG